MNWKASILWEILLVWHSAPKNVKIACTKNQFVVEWIQIKLGIDNKLLIFRIIEIEFHELSSQGARYKGKEQMGRWESEQVSITSCSPAHFLTFPPAHKLSGYAPPILGIFNLQ